MNKRGLENKIILLGIVFLVIVLFMVLYWFYSLFAPPLQTAFLDLSNSALIVTGNETPNNLSEIVRPFVETGNKTIQNLEWISYGLFFCMLIGFIIFAAYVREAKALVLVWIFLVIILVVISMWLSNDYVEHLGGYYESQYVGWGFNDFLMRHLPFVMGTFGFLFGLMLFIFSFREGDEGVEVAI